MESTRLQEAEASFIPIPAETQEDGQLRRRCGLVADGRAMEFDGAVDGEIVPVLCGWRYGCVLMDLVGRVRDVVNSMRRTLLDAPTTNSYPLVFAPNRLL